MRHFGHRWVFCSALALSACSRCIGPAVRGNGVERTEARKIAQPFDQVALETDAVVDVAVGSPAAVTVTCDANLVPYIGTLVHSGSLLIGRQKNHRGVWLRPTKSCEVQVTTPTLTKVTNSGAGILTLAGVRAPAFDIVESGAGKIEATALDVEHLRLVLSGAGSLTVSGKAHAEEITLSGTGLVAAKGLIAEQAGADLSGAGAIELTATKDFEGKLTGLGKVSVAGNPKDRHVTQSGLGTVAYE